MKEPKAIAELAHLFSRLPGIGPRQARRFVYTLLIRGAEEVQILAKALNTLPLTVKRCPTCQRFFDGNGHQAPQCELCRDIDRDQTLLMIVEKDADIGAVENAASYNGQYFILGGLLPVLEKTPNLKIKSDELSDLVKEKIKHGLQEIIIALAASSEGDNTIDYLKPFLAKILTGNKVKISILGRGLSTGSELEYADSDTLKNALKNRA